MQSKKAGNTGFPQAWCFLMQHSLIHRPVESPLRYAALFGALFSLLLLCKIRIFGVTIVTGYYDCFIWKFDDRENMEWLSSKGLAKRCPGSRKKEIKDAEQLNESTGPQNSTE